MNEITVRFRSKNKPFDPAFFEHLSAVAEEHEVIMDESKENEDQPKTANSHPISHEEYERIMQDIRERIGPIEGDSAEVIRALRDNL